MKRLIAILTSALLLCGLVLPVMASAAGLDSAFHYMSGGMSHTLAVKADGSVWAWGSNQMYQLGVPDPKDIGKPVKVEGLTSIVTAVAGFDISAALRFDGQVYTWGLGKDQEPTLVPGLSGVNDIAVGQTDLLALKTDGTVWQWSYGGVPQQVFGLEQVAAVSAGGSHYLALTTMGEVWAWGDNSSGQLGTDMTLATNTPVKVTGLFDVVDIAAGYSHSLAVTFGGQVFSWGQNTYGELGNGKTENSATPVQVSTLKDVTQVSAGNELSMALTESGQVYTWGYGEFGQLGASDAPISQSRPKLITSQDQTIVQVASGVYHSLMVDKSGNLSAWGRNKGAQISDSKSGNVHTPKRVLTGVAFEGGYHVDVTAGMDAWAVGDTQVLYEKQLVPPMLWGSYQTQITRAEFSHMLVSVYERVKGTNVGGQSANNFKDISGHTLETDIKKAFHLGIITGTSDNTASPNNAITRQEAAKMLCNFLAKLQGITISDQTQSLAFYSDASDIAEWAVPYVYYAYKNDIMKGTGDSTFSPIHQITRQESLVIIARLAQQFKWGEV